MCRRWPVCSPLVLYICRLVRLGKHPPGCGLAAGPARQPTAQLLKKLLPFPSGLDPCEGGPHPPCCQSFFLTSDEQRCAHASFTGYCLFLLPGFRFCRPSTWAEQYETEFVVPRTHDLPLDYSDNPPLSLRARSGRPSLQKRHRAWYETQKGFSCSLCKKRGHTKRRCPWI